MLIYNLDTRCLNFVTTWSGHLDKDFTINWFQILVKLFIICIRFCKAVYSFFRLGTLWTWHLTIKGYRDIHTIIFLIAFN